jgi:putative ABC transport system substrate-binding protein
MVVGGTVAAWPSVIRAQPANKVHRIGFVSGIGKPFLYPLSDPRSGIVRPFSDGLRELGYVDGQNIVLLRRSAEGIVGRGSDIASALIREGVDVIVVTSAVLAKEMRSVTTTVPIVVAASVDFVEMGLASSLARPGGNVTGFSNQAAPEIDAKRLQLLKETLSTIGLVAYLATRADWENANGIAIREAAQNLGISAVLAEHTAVDYADAFALIEKERPHALMVSSQLWTWERRQIIFDLALQHRMLVIYPWRDYVASGGLMSYGINLPDQYRRAAGYVDKILKGASPADLPIQQPTNYELIINLKTARAMGIEVPSQVLAQAAEVIE